ncbi:MAG TPA: phosphoenolpyruvate synthase [Chitinophagaceae bacterium]|nr:phosphoenolpyruvate synthase [Chitinophagaceae bacterium]
MKNERFILPLESVRLSDIALVGGKCASLGEMIGNLSALGVHIPGGFVITTEAYYQFLEQSGLEPMIKAEISKIDFDNVESLRRSGSRIRQAISNAKFPHELSSSIIGAYEALSKNYDQQATDVAVRSSATSEDLPDASFAGQQETFLNVRGPAALIDAVRNCFASLFTDRAISYRHQFNFDIFDVGLSVCVQKMVRSDLAVSGVAFSLDTESGFKDVVIINASYGLGELIVQGAVSPDEYIVFKPTRRAGYNSIIEKKIGAKDRMMIYGDDTDSRTRLIPTDRQQQHRFCLNDEQILQLADWVTIIEDYYSEHKGQWCPMDVEWAVDGLSSQLYIVQARPETIHSRKERLKLVEYDIKLQGQKPLLKGIAVGSKAASGKVNIMYSLDKRVEGNEFEPGNVLVTDMTDPDWEPIMKKASAIITNKGGRTCHAAIVAREMGVPAIVGCGNATELLADGQLITVNCAEGEEGSVYEGLLEIKIKETDIDDLPQTQTPLMLNVGSPASAFQSAILPHKGVGLAREEFIINNYIQAHPLALLRHKECNDKNLTEAIQQLTKGFADEETYFIQKLAFGIAKIAAAFYPEKVIVRFSDFKSNEYYNLLGGKYFEPTEENPMIGWRGASRYYSPQYKEAFGLECKAIRHVRETLGLTNVTVMIPFCRTVEELLKVQAVMQEFGLARGENGLEIFLMAELPSNIILAESFAEYIDGFSIGSNDLTQLTLGLDRDSSLVAHLYNERNESVKGLIRQLIRTAKAKGVKVGICGQGPSDFPDFAQFLVKEGIDSISVTPDSLIKTTKAIFQIEQAVEQLLPDPV